MELPRNHNAYRAYQENVKTLPAEPRADGGISGGFGSGITGADST
jgi:hypothetical protein